MCRTRRTLVIIIALAIGAGSSAAAQQSDAVDAGTGADTTFVSTGEVRTFPYASSVYLALLGGYPLGVGMEAGWHIGKVFSVGLGYTTAGTWNELPGITFALRAHIPLETLPFTPYVSLLSAVRGDDSGLEIAAGALYSLSAHLHLRGQLGVFEVSPTDDDNGMWNTGVLGSSDPPTERSNSYVAARISVEFTL
jgi:hypothetical protein